MSVAALTCISVEPLLAELPPVATQAANVVTEKTARSVYLSFI